MTDALDDLRQVPLFAGMTDHALEAVSELAVEREFGEGSALLTEGEPGESFFLLVHGQVHVTRGGTPGRTRGPGDFMGEISLIDGRPRTATATATGPVRVLEIRRDGFLRLMDRFAAVRLGVLMALTDRVRNDEQQPITC
jgi:CRP/FNR family cyclic AMP-dependent transcriptional regulator